jgi:hypothetical protein
MFTENQRTPRLFILCAGILTTLVLGYQGYSQQNVAIEAPIQAFNEQVKQYMELHKRVQDSLPPVDEASHPELIVPRQKQLGEGIRQIRTNAKQGQVFTPQVRPVFLDVIRKELNGPTGQQARSMILGEENPKSSASPAKFQPAVNGPYPATAPRTTVPPFLLLRLPELPKGLEYRFVGRDLVLVDTVANLIVDILPQAVS